MTQAEQDMAAGAVNTGLNLAIPGAGIIGSSAYQLWKAYDQKKKAESLAKRGPADIVPAALKQKLQMDQNQANNTQIAGYGTVLDNINSDVSSALGEGKRGATSSSNVLNLISRLNDNSNKAKNTLAIQGQNENVRRQGVLSNTLGRVGEYQNLGLQQHNAALGALQEGSIQNTAGGINTLASGLNYLTPQIGDMAEMAYRNGNPVTSSIDSVRFDATNVPTTPDPMEIEGMTGGSSPVLNPTPAMAGMNGVVPGLFNQSVPNPYEYKGFKSKFYNPTKPFSPMTSYSPKTTNTYLPSGYQKKYQNRLFNESFSKP